MSTSLLLLGLISRGETHGYDLKRDFDRSVGAQKQIPFGQVYSTLARLSRDGLVEELGTEQGAGPDRKTYRITELGRQRVRAWLDTPEQPQESLHATLLAKLMLATLIDGDPEALLRIQHAKHLQRLRELVALRRAAPPGEMIAYDYAMFHVEADIRWIEHTSARLTQLTTHWRNA